MAWNNVILVVGAGAILLVLASRIYPFWIQRVFGVDDARPTPASDRADGHDFVRSPTAVVFAHHFASIAGAGPIVGPILALAYGWGWAWLWIVIGGIFYGAMHDMSSMIVSVREGGQTIAEIARRELGKFGYLLFVTFLLIVLSVVNAIFLNFSAGALTSSYPLELLGVTAENSPLRLNADGSRVVVGGVATTSVIVMTLAAPLLGWLIHRRRLDVRLAFGLAALVCAAGVLIGFVAPVQLTPDTWKIVLTIYVFIACWIPVWVVLQPRDFMNVQILYGGVALLLIGVCLAGFGGDVMQLPASSVEAGAARMGPVWPIMFITIACGAISGFHSLVATGTTVKQIPRESDCRRVGYNAMILESLLALLVLAAVAGQLTAADYTANLNAPAGAIQTFALGCGRTFAHLGIPLPIGCVLGILVIEGFLVTTLDTAVRLGRFLFEELWVALLGEDAPGLIRSHGFNTACTVGLMLVFVFSEAAAQALWPFFGAGNQLIGALTLTTVTVWLLRRGKTIWFVAIPAVLMTITAMAALGHQVYAKVIDDSLAAGPRAIMVGSGSFLLLLAGGFVLTAAVRIRSAAATVTR